MKYYAKVHAVCTGCSGMQCRNLPDFKWLNYTQTVEIPARSLQDHAKLKTQGIAELRKYLLTFLEGEVADIQLRGQFCFNVTREDKPEESGSDIMDSKLLWSNIMDSVCARLRANEWNPAELIWELNKPTRGWSNAVVHDFEPRGQLTITILA